VTITLFPCESTVVCGPCPVCVELIDILSPSPDRRTVIWQPAPGDTSLSGTVFWLTGGSAPMSAVAEGNKLCVSGLSYDGPLLYCTAVPYAAVLESVTLQWTPPDEVPVSADLDVVETCADPSTEIKHVVTPGDCYMPATVVAVEASCPLCCPDTASKWFVYPAGSTSVFASATGLIQNAMASGSVPTASSCGSITAPGGLKAALNLTATVSYNLQSLTNSDMAFYAMAITNVPVSDSISFVGVDGYTVSCGYELGFAKAANSWVITQQTRRMTPLSSSGTVCHGSVRSALSPVQDTVLVRIPGGCRSLIMSAYISTLVQNGSWPHINYDSVMVAKLGYAA